MTPSRTGHSPYKRS